MNHGENHRAHLQQLIHNWFVHTEEGLRLFLFFLCIFFFFPLKTGNWKKIDAWQPKLRRAGVHRWQCWGFWFWFNSKCKATFGRLDSTIECAKILPMEKELNAKSQIQVLELHGVFKQSTAKANIADKKEKPESWCAMGTIKQLAPQKGLQEAGSPGSGCSGWWNKQTWGVWEKKKKSPRLMKSDFGIKTWCLLLSFGYCFVFSPK